MKTVRRITIRTFVLVIIFSCLLNTYAQKNQQQAPETKQITIETPKKPARPAPKRNFIKMADFYLKDGKLVFGKPFTYKAIVEIYPVVEVKSYEGIALEKEKVEVSKDEIESELKRLQQQMTQLEPSPEGELEKGMVAMIDFNGKAGGEIFPGSEAENYVVDFGTGALLKEFEVQIKGMKTNEERDIEFHYPKDYFRKEVAGKKGEFKVKVKEVRRKIVPELNDEFAKELGEYKSLKDVRAELKKRILEYKEGVVKRNLMDQAVRKLIDDNQSLEVPSQLVDAELGNMLEQLKRQYEMQGRKFDDSKIDPKQFVQANVKEATERARGYMIVSAIANKENISCTDEELDKRIELIAQSNKQPVSKVRQELEKNKMIDNLRSQMVFEKTVDMILGKAKIKERKAKKEKKTKKS